jgi:hypothetical protein
MLHLTSYDIVKLISYYKIFNLTIEDATILSFNNAKKFVSTHLGEFERSHMIQ